MPKQKNEELDGELAAVETVQPMPLAASAPAAPVATPRHWAEKLGNIVKGDPRVPQSRTFAKMEHAVADKLHGWSQHEHHYQASPLLITQAAYEAALEAACNPTTKVPAPHEPALSPVKRAKESR